MSEMFSTMAPRQSRTDISCFQVLSVNTCTCSYLCICVREARLQRGRVARLRVRTAVLAAVTIQRVARGRQAFSCDLLPGSSVKLQWSSFRWERDLVVVTRHVPARCVFARGARQRCRSRSCFVGTLRELGRKASGPRVVALRAHGHV